MDHVRHHSLTLLATVTALLLALIVPQGAAAEESPWIQLHGHVEENAVQLTWTMTRWEPGVTGFVVMRQPATATAPWQRIHSGTIEPGMWPGKDLANVEPDAAGRERLQAKLRLGLSEQQVKAVSPDDFFKTMRDPPADFFEALRREFFLDADRALLLGLGCIDRRLEPRAAYRYGLFPVKNGQPDEKPAAEYVMPMFRRDDERLRVSNLRVVRADVGNTLSWEFEEEKMRQWSIYGFRVYRAAANDGPFSLLTLKGVGTARTEGKMRVWTYVDKSAQAGANYRYRVVPYDYFQHELVSSTTVDLAPVLPTTAVIKLVLTQDPDTRASVLTWTTSGFDEQSITGWIVERGPIAHDPSPTLPGLTPLANGRLEAPARQLTDNESKRDQEAYAYRVSATFAGGATLQSNTVVLVYFDLPTPPAPSGLSAEPVILGGVPAIRLRWNPPATDDRVTRGFLLYADLDAPSRLDQQASVPEVKAPSAEAYLPLHLAESRLLTVGVAGIGRGGNVGPVTKTQVFAAGKLPSGVSDLVVTPLEDGRAVSLMWRYPAGHEIAGFRVKVNGALLADESVLRPNTRTWRYEIERPRSEYAFDVAAVSLAGEPAMPQRAYFSPVARSMPIKPPAPENVHAGWTPDRQQITATWTMPGGTSGVSGYLVAVDEEAIGKFGRPQSVPMAAPLQFTYRPPTTDRSYTFRVWAVGAQQAGGGPAPTSLYVDTICLAPGRTLVPAKIEQVTSALDTHGQLQVRARWNYTGASLAGFRIYQDDVLVRRETEIGGTARDNELPAPAQHGTYRYAIEAVDTRGEVSERGPAYIFVYR